MRRVPPSTVVREEIQELFTNGVDRGTNILSALAELGVRYLTQQALEQEQGDYLGRGHYERRVQEQPRGWRNGYEDTRLKTAEGEMAVRIPQVRDAGEPYRSKLMEFLEGHSDVPRQESFHQGVLPPSRLHAPPSRFLNSGRIPDHTNVTGSDYLLSERCLRRCN